MKPLQKKKDNKKGNRKNASTKNTGTKNAGKVTAQAAHRQTANPNNPRNQAPKTDTNAERTFTREKPTAKEPKLQPLHKRSVFIFGRHAIEAALRNENRDCLRLIGLERALDKAGDMLYIRKTMRIETATNDSILNSVTPPDSPHQGMVLEVMPLDLLPIEDMKAVEGTTNLILMLDQVTDPHNIGACLRAAAALGARALITPDRHTPLESGIIARTSAGALESIPWLRVANITQTLDQLKGMGYWSVGMDGDTDTALKDVSLGDNVVLVMGSEGKGMRDLTRKSCDVVAKIPMTDKVESLNVATAAAIGVYELGMRK